jgi:transcriptional regulator with PAS, ATPase and Fis domain
VDIRIVSACNEDLWQASEQGKFRKDLYFRLATIRIDLPALRDRPEDILPLASFFMEEFNDKYGKRFRGLSAESEELLLRHSWPGNVRELRNTMERVILLEHEDTVLARHLLFLQQGSQGIAPSQTVHRFHMELPPEGIALEKVERDVISEAYKHCQKNKSKTARFLHIPRHILLYRMKKHGIE